MSQLCFRFSAEKFALTAALAAPGLALFGGCSGHGRGAVPSDAITLGSGEGRKRLNVVVPHGGTAYVLDREADKIVWSGEVHTDDRLAIDGAGHRITLNDQTVAGDVRGDHHYWISYDTPYRP